MATTTRILQRKIIPPSSWKKSLKDNGVHILADSYEFVDDRVSMLWAERTNQEES